jgi:hypothetical protein
LTPRDTGRTLADIQVNRLCGHSADTNMKPESLSEDTIKRLQAPARGNSITYFAGATVQGAKAPRGFGVRVTASGARAFILNYRLRGREHRFTIGAWPDWSALRAVREARNLRRRVDRGEDPLTDRAPIPATKSVSGVIDDFMTRYVRSKERPLRSADQIQSAFDRLVKPLIGKIGVYELPPWEAPSIFRVLGTKQNFSPPNAKDRWFRILPIEIQNQEPPVYVNGDKVAVIEVFQPGASGPVFPPQLIRDALAAIDCANPPLTPASQSKTRYAAPVIAQAIAHHRGGRASDAEGKAILDHITSAGLVHVISVKVRRTGGRSDDLNCLVLTPAGKAVIQQASQGPSNSPQSPQSPAVSTTGTAENAGGDPLAGPPHC